MPPGGSGGAMVWQNPNSTVQDVAPKKKKARGRTTRHKNAIIAMKKAAMESKQSVDAILQNDDDQLRKSSVSTTEAESEAQEAVEGQIGSKSADQPGSNYASENANVNLEKESYSGKEPEAESRNEAEQKTENKKEPEPDEKLVPEQKPSSEQKQEPTKKAEFEKKLEPERPRRLSAQAQVFRPTSIVASTSPTTAIPRSSTFAHNNYTGDNTYIQYDQASPFTPQWVLNAGNQFNSALIQQLQTPVFNPYVQQSPVFLFSNTQLGSPTIFTQQSPVNPSPTTALRIDPSQRPADQRKPFNISPELPLGWVRRFDSEKKKYLYINFYTQETQWQEPKTEARQEILASGVKNSEELGTTEDTKLEVQGPSTESEFDKTSIVNTGTETTNSQAKSKRNRKNIPLDADGIVSAKFNPIELHNLVRSTTPSRHIPAACLEPNKEDSSAKPTRRKKLSPDTNFIPNPMVTFLVDEVDSLTCQLCEETTMTLSKPTCKVTDAQASLMPCGHVAGSRCLHLWLGTGRSACPFCGFSLRHLECGHLRAPLVLNRVTILDAPKTVPEGGAFAGCCRACRLEKLEVNEVMRARALKARVLEARAALEEDERPETEGALEKAVRELEDLSFTNREKRLGHLLILW